MTVQFDNSVPKSLREGFTIIPNAVLRDPGLNVNSKIVYAVLLSFAWRTEQGRNPCTANQSTLCQAIGWSANSHKTLRTSLDELEAAGWIRRGKKKLGGTIPIFVLSEPGLVGVSEPNLIRVSEPGLVGVASPEKKDEVQEDKREEDNYTPLPPRKRGVLTPSSVSPPNAVPDQEPFQAQDGFWWKRTAGVYHWWSEAEKNWIKFNALAVNTNPVPDFDLFWGVIPPDFRANEKDCRKLWRKIPAEEKHHIVNQAALLYGIAAQAPEDRRTFVVRPKAFLTKQRWMDTPESWQQTLRAQDGRRRGNVLPPASKTDPDLQPQRQEVPIGYDGSYKLKAPNAH